MLDIPKLISDLGADVTAIRFDKNEGLNDRLARYIEEKGILPDTKRKRMALAAAILAASRVAEQQLGAMGPVTNFVSGVGNDMLREWIKRVLEPVDAVGTRVIDIPPRRAQIAPAPSVVVGAIANFNAFMFPWMATNKGT